MSADRHHIVATAGHIDHGKSTLVEALTGTNPDRLPEEKKRGMTIELGSAHLRLAHPADPAAGSLANARWRRAAGSNRRIAFKSMPAEALRKKQTGTVRLLLYINEQGTVDKVEIVQSSGFPSLDAAAMAAERRSTFRPAIINGSPVKSKVIVPYIFQL